MSDNSRIEWTEATWNPSVGCTKVTPGCDRCYAEGQVNRWHAANKPAFPNRFDVMHVRPDTTLLRPLSWTRPKRVFVNSLSDLFHKDVPDETIARVFAVMALAPQHTFQLLTKRHGRMHALLNDERFAKDVGGEFMSLVLDGHSTRRVSEFAWPLPNLWLGVSTENQQWADVRIPKLVTTPAAVRFISAEPLLGEIDLTRWLWLEEIRLDWVIAGGESGHGNRSLDLDWVRLMRDQCAASVVPFFFKQVGGRTPKAGGRDLDGRTHDEYPHAHTHRTIRPEGTPLHV